MYEYTGQKQEKQYIYIYLYRSLYRQDVNITKCQALTIVRINIVNTLTDNLAPGNFGLPNKVMSTE